MRKKGHVPAHAKHSACAAVDRWPTLPRDADPQAVRLYTIDTGPEQKAPPPVFLSWEAAAEAAARSKHKGAKPTGFFVWFYERNQLVHVVLDNDHRRTSAIISTLVQNARRRNVERSPEARQRRWERKQKKAQQADRPA